MKLPLLLAALLTLTSCVSTRVVERPDFAKHFEAQNARGTFVLYNPQSRRFHVHNPQRAEERRTPASTFKLFNSLAALDAGVVPDEETVLPWDGEQRFVASWNQDLDMKDAFRYSAVWYYQELARRIGEQRMRDYIRKVNYGNGEIGTKVDLFWLDGPLAISPYEQIAFLRRLESGRLPFSRRAREAVRRISVAESGPGWTLHAKTGWATNTQPGTGWYVGWVEKEFDVWFFAMNIDITTDADAAKRIPITRAILDELGIIPARNAE